MYRILFAFLLSNFVAGSAQGLGIQATQPVEPKQDIATISRDASKSVVLVVVSDANGREIRQGSGVIVSTDGKVVTNYHVIDGSSSAVIKFPNGAFFLVGGVLATNKEKDIAVLKASGSDFSPLALGDSDKLQVGEEVVSIGSPLSLEATVSNGIISSIRDMKDERQPLVQTTAPVSPGSSGGALLNMRGELIGITTAQMSSGQNLNFAVPINIVKPFLSASSLRKLGDQPVAHENLSGRVIQHLRDVKTVAVGPLGTTQAANLVREKMINRLAQSNQLMVVTEPDEADAVLNGIVGENVYGNADTAAFRLVDKAGHILWTDEAGRPRGGSASGHIAEKIVNDLLTAIAKDTKRDN